jgi:hypothetical protein
VIFSYQIFSLDIIWVVFFKRNLNLIITNELILFHLAILPSIRFEVNCGTEMVSPRGSRANFTKNYKKRRTDECRTQIWREVVLEIPWHMRTSFKTEILVHRQRNLVFCQEKGAVSSSILIHPNLNFLFLDFSLLFLFFYCVTKLYQIHLKSRITVSCGLSG